MDDGIFGYVLLSFGFKVETDVGINGCFSSFFPHISFILSLNILNLSYYFIPFILIFYPFYPAILSLLSCYFIPFILTFILLIIRSGPGLIWIVAAPA